MRTRFLANAAAAVVALAGLAAPAVAVTYLNQISGGSQTGSYASSFAAGNSCMDDFEIFGTTGGSGPLGMVQITGVEAVFTGSMPLSVRVNIYRNTDPTLNNLRTQVTGDAYSHVFLAPQFQVIPFGSSGEAGNFPNGFLLTIPISGLNLEFGSYYLSVQSMDPTGNFFIAGSNNVTEGTPNDLVHVLNQGAQGIANQIPDNAAYRVMGVPTPGACALLGLGMLAATRRRR